MSSFAYKAEGELNSQYLSDLLKEYLNKLLESNDTKGIVEGEYKIDPNKSAISQWFGDTTKRLFNSGAVLDNYNKVMATKYTSAILDKIDIFLQTNVLSAKQLFDLKQTLQAIHFNAVVPLLDEGREKAIKLNQKRFLKVISHAKYLKHADANYILYNSPVDELKPFLSDKVSTYQAEVEQIQKLVYKLIDKQYEELTVSNFEPTEINFVAKDEDFYNDMVTDNGIGEEVEKFVRSKMLEKFKISKREEELKEDLDIEINQIDILLKKLKLSKIEKMLQNIIKLKTNIAQAKEVIDSCKDIINTSTIPNKAQIFLVMDNLYYKLSKKCEMLQQNAKQKLQLVDKQKMFAMLESIKAQVTTTKSSAKSKKVELFDESDINEDILNEDIEKVEDEPKKSGIASNLYDDDDKVGDINITEDDSGDPEDEFVIEEDADEENE